MPNETRRDEIVKDELDGALEQCRQASRELCHLEVDPTDINVQRTMLAHERAADRLRHFIYIKNSAREEAVAGPPHRLRIPLSTRTA